MYSEIIINKNYDSINPIQFGYEKCEKSHSYGPVARMFWLFHFVVSGKGIFRIEEKEYHLTRGMMFVIPPFVETFYEADAEEPWEYIWVGFTGEPPLALENVYEIPQVYRIFEHMKAARRFQKGRTEFVLAHIWELFSVLLEEKREKTDPIDEALNLIHAEYMTALTVQQMAKRIHLERTYFSSLFHKRMGQSPKQYLLHYRMEQALVLLKHGYSVTVTAASVGYQDVYNFSKMFKKYYGQMPSLWRKQSMLQD